MYRWIFLLIIMFSNVFCTDTKSLQSSNDLNNPLVAYRKGNYRKVMELLENSSLQESNLELQYILGSSYLELREYRKAFNQFHQIDAEKLYESQKFKDIFPFYVRKYLRSLEHIDNGNILTLEDEKRILEIVALVPKDSPIRTYMDQELFSALWKQKKYATMLLFNKNLSVQGRAWVEIAKYELKQKFNIFPIIDSQEFFSSIPAYSNVLQLLDPKDFRNKEDLTNLVEMSLRIPKYRNKALEFASELKDPEYYARTQFRIMILNGNRRDAALYVYNYTKKFPEVSTDFYTNTHAQLIRHQLGDLADEIALQANQVHNQNFYFQSQGGIEFHKNPDYVLNWYRKYYTNLAPEQHNEVLRALIRTDLKKAEEASDLGIEYNLDHPQYILTQGLIKEELGKKQEAYKNYLRLIFQDPFGYSGIVAKEKEKVLREEFRYLFDNAVDNILERLPFFPLRDRLMLYKSFLVDSELSKYIDDRKLARDQKEFDRLVYRDLGNISKISILEKYPKTLSNLAPETHDYVENAVLERMENDERFHNFTRYYYQYRDILLDSDTEGYLTFLLYFYVRDKHGYTYLPNYPEELVKLIFPKPEFELIKKWSNGDEDLAYWMLSSFMAESHFRKRVYSSVGAVGFAQVMPYTAVDIKRWMERPELSNYDFYDNLRMGVYYHKKLYEDMGNNIILSLVAYNAGPTAANRWRRNYSNIKDKYLFVEVINYKETRNYVKSIVYNHAMYRLINDYDLY